jgi:KDO2-lipid IV(A) lauroyltransferase
LRNIRAAIAANLEPVLGPCGWWERQVRIHRTMHEFAWCLSERYERLAVGRRPQAVCQDEEVWRAVLASGTGFLMVTGHLGAWEVGSMAPASEERRRVHLVREAEADPEADRFIRDLVERSASGLFQTHFFAAGEPRFGAVLLDALRAGDIVALQGDRPRAGGRTLAVPLFGRPFPFPIGPPALARAAGAPLVPIFVFREGRLRYRVRVWPPIEVPQTADREADLRGALTRFAAALEAAIRERPHQWFCFGKVWE